MSNPKDKLKGRLLAEAEASIERMGQPMTITEIEDVIGELEMDFRQCVLGEVMGEPEN